MQLGERVALPPVALAPVYFFGKIPKGEGGDGKDYQKEIEEERSKPHWLELMKDGLHIVSEQQRPPGRRRRVDLKEAAQSLVLEETRKRRQFIFKDYDKSSPALRSGMGTGQLVTGSFVNIFKSTVGGRLSKE